MKNVLPFAFLLLLSAQIHAQSKTITRLFDTYIPRPDNYLYVELLGSGSWASVNYERFLYKNIGLRIGYNGGGGLMLLTYKIPNGKVGFNMGVQRKPYAIHFGVDGMKKDEDPEFRFTTAFEFEFTGGDGFYSKISFVQFYGNKNTEFIIPSLGVSLGYAF